MLQIYLKIAWRNLLKNKTSSFINLGGLAVGMAVAILIALWVWDELTFNTYHQNYDHIAQVMKRANYDGKTGVNGIMSYPLAVQLKDNFKEQFKHIVIARQEAEFNLSHGENKLSRTGLFMDAEAPEMLSLKMLQGSWSGLNELHSIMLTSSTARALFGNKDPVGEIVTINNNTDVKVTGIYEDLPLNSEFHDIQFFAPFPLDLAINPWIKEQGWDNQFLRIFVEINPKTDFKKISSAIENAELNAVKDLDNYQKQAFKEPKIFLNPMSEWHLHSNFENGTRQNGPIQFVWLIGIIGLFVLLLACINFVNLSTAHSQKRAKEVGIRKTVGSPRGKLIIQFFIESLVVVILAFAVSFTLVSLFLPWFNDLASKEIILPLENIWFWGYILLFILCTSLLAGIYPAVYLSSFKPIQVLKGTIVPLKHSSLPRKIMVVSQFTISVTLIICTIIIYNQVIFAENRPVGYNQEGLIMVEKKSEDFYGKLDLLRNELKKTGMVDEVAESDGQVTNVWQWHNGFTWPGKDPDTDPIFGSLAVTSEYGNTIGWKIIDGRDFSADFSTDSSAIIINEAAARLIGFDDPIGKSINRSKDGQSIQYNIIGVVKNKVMESPYEPTVPSIFRLGDNLRWINIRLNPMVGAGEALPIIATVFKKLIPSAPFDYKFSDKEYDQKFTNEKRIGKFAGFFASLAIFISCLGLFGLASFTIEQRIKEISIRKVLGASVLDVWQLLSKEFIILVVIALSIATPVAYYFMKDWLQNYQYRTELSGWIFILTAVVTILITLLTVSFQALKAAFLNPAKNLKTE